MTNYVLGDESLHTSLVGLHEKNPDADQVAFAKWAKTLTQHDFLFASRMSVAMPGASIERIQNPARRESSRRAIESKLTGAFKDSLFEVDEATLKHWPIIRASIPDTQTAEKRRSRQNNSL